MENKKKKKIDFKKKKEKTFNSLMEVESFLNRACKLKKVGTIGKLFK